jgi:AcrR family transcriptional regulator
LLVFKVDAHLDRRDEPVYYRHGRYFTPGRGALTTRQDAEWPGRIWYSETMTAPTEEHKEDPARAALDRAARALFTSKGYAGSHIGAIAKAAGVSISTVYSRYGSKEQVWRETMGSEPPSRSDPGQPLSGRSQRARDRLLSAARICIERDGYHATRVSDIAAEAGAAVGSFYAHFPSKQAVFTAAVNEAILKLAELQRPRPVSLRPDDDRSPRQLREHAASQIKLAIERFVDRYLEYGAILVMRLDEAIGSHPELIALRLAAHQQYADAIADSVRSWQDAGIADPNLDPRHTGDALASMVGHATRVWLVLGGPHDRETAVDTLTRLWANGIGLDQP